MAFEPENDPAMAMGHPDRVTCAACGGTCWREEAEIRTVADRDGLVCPDCQAWDDE